MAPPVRRARQLVAAWVRRPSRAAADAMRRFYGRNLKSLPLSARAPVCQALGEAAELEEELEFARYLYASAVTAVDPLRDERAYARAALRALVNASRRADRPIVSGVARLVERLPAGEVTPRLALLGFMARGLERLSQGNAAGARRSFEAALGASGKSDDAEGEAEAHRFLAVAWMRLRKVARAREHLQAARRAAARAGGWCLERSVALDDLALRLSVRPAPEVLSEARRVLTDLRRRGFRRLEARTWAALAKGVLGGPPGSKTLLALACGGRGFVRSLDSALARAASAGPDPRLRRELRALAHLARS